jgi:SPP1 gp7 family putative phage head morphogenesis protein
MAQAVQKAVKPKFYGNDTLRSKVITHYPENLAAEHEAIARQYMALLNKTLKEHLPEIRRGITAEREGRRLDDDFSVSRMIRRVMDRALADFERRAAHFGLERKILTLANQTRRFSISEWKRVVNRTLGINILEDYYKGEFYRNTMQQWVTNNVSLIKTLPGETMTRMENIIQGGYLRGASNTEMGKLIQEAYGVEKDRALFIARDQTSKLNAELTQSQQKDAGVEEYVWDSSGDSRVRPCHRELNGKTISWNDPPEMWYETKGGRVYTGRRCHPGEDYQCRCVALPKFDLDNLSLPWDGKGGG